MRKRKRQGFDLVGNIIAWEEGRSSPAKEKRLFQHLVNTGQAWTLQGMYGRQAQAMLEAGIIHPPKKRKRSIL